MILELSSSVVVEEQLLSLLDVSQSMEHNALLLPHRNSFRGYIIILPPRSVVDETGLIAKHTRVQIVVLVQLEGIAKVVLHQLFTHSQAGIANHLSHILRHELAFQNSLACEKTETPAHHARLTHPK